MEQLQFFAEPACLDADDLEARIDPQLDAAFLADLGEAFAALLGPAPAALEADAA